jgi:hypothetical protein
MMKTDQSQESDKLIILIQENKKTIPSMDGKV